MNTLTLAFLQAAPHADPQVGAGRIVGGWEYVWAGYGIALAALVLYSLSLWFRRPRSTEPLSRTQP